jgi:hypothetical protein
MALARQRDRDQIEKLLTLSAKVFTIVLRTLSALALLGAIGTAFGKNPIYPVVSAALAAVFFLIGLVSHYRRRKNAYAEHILAIGNAARFLAANQKTLDAGSLPERRRIYEELLRAFRSIHDTLPRNPTQGWQVALWAPESPDKLRILASVDVSHRTEDEYFMGTGEGCVEGLAWKAWHGRKTRISKDAANDPDVDHDHHRLSQSPDKPTEIGSILCQIVCLDECVIGVISLNHAEKGLFTAEEDDARAAVAGLVAIAMKCSYDCDSHWVGGG